MSESKIIAKNKRANFEYFLTTRFIAGIQITGTEIKSIREGKVNITDAYCVAQNNEIFVRNMHIAEYKYGTYNNHEPKRDRKLLLEKKEIKKIVAQLEQKGVTLVPTAMILNENGLAKLEIAIAKGKKLYDKRDSIKDRDNKRDLDRSHHE